MNPATINLGGNSSGTLIPSPSGKYLYMLYEGQQSCDLSPGSISVFAIGATGSLTHVADNIAQGCSLIFDATGKYAYVADSPRNVEGAGTVSQYLVNSDGTFTPLSVPTVPVAAAFMVLHPSGKYVYIEDITQQQIVQFTIGATGALTQASTTSASAYSAYLGGAVMAIDPSGRYLYLAGVSDISLFSINSDGTLTAKGSAATFPCGDGPTAIIVTSKYAYFGDCSSPLGQYVMQSDGTLAAISPVNIVIGLGSFLLTADPTNRYLYANDSYGETTITQSAIGSSGALTPLNPARVDIPLGAISLATVSTN